MHHVSFEYGDQTPPVAVPVALATDKEFTLKVNVRIHKLRL
jgi:hypothetical protein